MLATIQRSVRKLFQGKGELLANRFWPKDPRINNDNFDNILELKWYAVTPLYKKRERDEEEDSLTPEVKKVKTEYSSSRPTSSSGISQESTLIAPAPCISDDGTTTAATATTRSTKEKKPKKYGIGLYRYQTSELFNWYGVSAYAFLCLQERTLISTAHGPGTCDS